MKTTKLSDIKREWHLIDAGEYILGRLCTEVALKLSGKNKPYFVRNLDCGDYVVIINAKKIKVTGKKEEKKQYQNYSGFPGGLKSKSLKQVRESTPERIIEEAVRGMLPNNKLRDRMITKLYIFSDEKHPYQDKFTK